MESLNNTLNKIISLSLDFVVYQQRLIRLAIRFNILNVSKTESKSIVSAILNSTLINAKELSLSSDIVDLKYDLISVNHLKDPSEVADDFITVSMITYKIVKFGLTLYSLIAVSMSVTDLGRMRKYSAFFKELSKLLIFRHNPVLIHIPFIN